MQSGSQRRYDLYHPSKCPVGHVFKQNVEVANKNLSIQCEPAENISYIVHDMARMDTQNLSGQPATCFRVHYRHKDPSHLNNLRC